MEQSTVGEFSIRLEIILAFHCHLVHAAMSHKMTSVLTSFINSLLIYCRTSKKYLYLYKFAHSWQYQKVSNIIVQSFTDILRSLLCSISYDIVYTYDYS